MSWAGMFASALIAAALGQLAEGLGELFMLLALPAAGIFGFFSVFMYGAWLGA